MSMENNEITRQQIEKVIKDIYDKREPDIIIFENEQEFSVTIDSSGGPRHYKMRTGKGGLIMYLQGFGNFAGLIKALKVRYNGVILSEEERDELFKEILK